MSRDSCARWVALSDREICGESLSKTDQQWYREHARRCLACAAEIHFYSKLDGVLNNPDFLEAHVASVAPPGRVRFRYTAWALAAACLGLGWFGYSRTQPHQLTAAPATSAATLRATPQITAKLVAAIGQVQLVAQPTKVGDPLLATNRLNTQQGQACVTTAETITSCLDDQSEAHWSLSNPGEVRIDLYRGRLLSRLETQPASRPFSVQTPAGRITAKGTVFSVTIEDGGRVTVQLHEGRLWLESRTNETSVLNAPAIASLDGNITTLPLSQSAIERDQALLTLSKLAFATRVGTVEKRLELVTVPEAAPVTLEGTALGKTPIVTAAPQVSPLPTAAKLFERAQQSRAQGRYTACANDYRQLLAAFPNSNEARVSMLSLGELELRELGRPQNALRAFEQYLEKGGPLSREARYGRISALEQLGRHGEAKTVATAFLHDYPKSVQAETLRRKYDVL